MCFEVPSRVRDQEWNSIEADEFSLSAEVVNMQPTDSLITPWQELYRQTIGQLEAGACADLATRYVATIARYGEPYHSH
jgi:xylonate dehydratase